MDSWRAAGCVVTDPAFGDAKFVGDLPRVQKVFVVAAMLRGDFVLLVKVAFHALDLDFGPWLGSGFDYRKIAGTRFAGCLRDKASFLIAAMDIFHLTGSVRDSLFRWCLSDLQSPVLCDGQHFSQPVRWSGIISPIPKNALSP